MKQRSKPSPRTRHTKRCENCGDPFQTFRRDTKYCSTACSQAAYRKRKAQEQA